MVLVSAGAFLPPFTGVAFFFVCMTVGELTSSLLLDNFGALGLPRREATGSRIGAVLLAMAGSVSFSLDEMQSQMAHRLAPGGSLFARCLQSVPWLARSGETSPAEARGTPREVEMARQNPLPALVPPHVSVASPQGSALNATDAEMGPLIS